MRLQLEVELDGARATRVAKTNLDFRSACKQNPACVREEFGPDSSPAEIEAARARRFAELAETARLVPRMSSAIELHIQRFG